MENTCSAVVVEQVFYAFTKARNIKNSHKKMKFELSERVFSTFSREELLVALEAQLRKISEGVVRSGQVIEAKAIKATFGSINRNDITYFHVNKVRDG